MSAQIFKFLAIGTATGGSAHVMIKTSIVPRGWYTRNTLILWL